MGMGGLGINGIAGNIDALTNRPEVKIARLVDGIRKFLFQPGNARIGGFVEDRIAVITVDAARCVAGLGVGKPTRSRTCW